VTNAIAAAPPAIEIFYSYAHEDRMLQERLENHLKFFKRQGLITSWTDRLIAPGTDWNREINDGLDRASIILLLLSEYFLASDYIDGVEMRRAFERSQTNSARVIPVILRECLWREDRRLSDLEVLPRNRRPVAGWRDRAKALAEVAAGIKGVAQDLVPQAPHGVAAAYPLPEDAGPRIEALPAIWNVPQRRDPAFLDRDSELATLAGYLADQRPGGAIVQVTGPPGIGKSSFAMEYAYRHASDYQAVWWIRADHSSTLASDLPALAWALRQPVVDSDPHEIWNALSPWLKQTSDYLLIFDDSADAEACLDLLPAAVGGHILITTRHDKPLSRPALGVALEPFSLDTSVAFVREHLSQVEPETADAVARRSAGVPLILSTATSYLSQNADFVDEFVGEAPAEAVREIADTGEAAVEFVLRQVQAANPEAADFLSLLSFMAPDEIPLPELSAAAVRVDDPFMAVLANHPQLEDLVEALADLDLAWSGGDVISLHRHIQGVIRADLSAADVARWAALAVRLVEGAFPADSRDPETWPMCGRLLPHALASAGHAESLGAAPLETGRLLRRLAVYLLGRAQDADARAAAERALAVHEAHLGTINEDVADDLVTLGRVHQAMDDLKAAREPFERAIAIREQLYGQTDPRVAHGLIYFGRFLRRIRDLQGAQQVLMRAIQLTEQAKGEDDPDVAWALGHLGRVLQDLGELPEAERALRRALAINEVKLGPEDPDVATDLVNLSRVQRELNELDAAAASLNRALDIATREYGSKHYEVGIVEANLGRVMQARGDFDGADRQFRRALSIFRASVGEEHSYTTETREWLAAAQRERKARGG
jgi:tetratricopeptide (TPR) repeat protein